MEQIKVLQIDLRQILKYILQKRMEQMEHVHLAQEIVPFTQVSIYQFQRI